MPPYICFCTDVLLYIYILGRKCLLSFKSELNSGSKSKLALSLSKSLFYIYENNLGLKILFKFDFALKPYFKKKLRKALFPKSS
jgi:hypothetical protein